MPTGNVGEPTGLGHREGPITEIANAVLPLLMVSLAAFALKRAGMLTAEDGGALLRVVFCVGIPPLAFLSILRVEIDAAFVALCLMPPFVIGISLAVVLTLRRAVLQHVDAKTFGPLLAGAVILNTGFLIPFVERIGGAEALARFIVIDASVCAMIYSVVYVLVARIANDTPDMWFAMRKVFSPPVLGILAATAVRLIDVPPPAVVIDSFELVAPLVGVSILVALGLKFEPRIMRPELLLLATGLRFGLGLALGAAFVKIMGLDGLDAGIVMFASVAPSGFNTITFAERERLDTAFAASQVSVGLVVAVVVLPLTTHFLL